MRLETRQQEFHEKSNMPNFHLRSPTNTKPKLAIKPASHRTCIPFYDFVQKKIKAPEKPMKKLVKVRSYVVPRQILQLVESDDQPWNPSNAFADSKSDQNEQNGDQSLLQNKGDSLTGLDVESQNSSLVSMNRSGDSENLSLMREIQSIHEELKKTEDRLSAFVYDSNENILKKSIVIEDSTPKSQSKSWLCCLTNRAPRIVDFVAGEKSPLAQDDDDSSASFDEECESTVLCRKSLDGDSSSDGSFSPKRTSSLKSSDRSSSLLEELVGSGEEPSNSCTFSISGESCDILRDGMDRRHDMRSLGSSEGISETLSELGDLEKEQSSTENEDGGSCRDAWLSHAVQKVVNLEVDAGHSVTLRVESTDDGYHQVEFEDSDLMTGESKGFSGVVHASSLTHNVSTNM